MSKIDVSIGHGDNTPAPTWILPFDATGGQLELVITVLPSRSSQVYRTDDLHPQLFAVVDHGPPVTTTVTLDPLRAQTAALPLGPASKYVLRFIGAPALPEAKAKIVAGGRFSTTDGPVDASAATLLMAGLQGIPGRSAYQIALDNGFTGSEQDWLASLSGYTLAPAGVVISGHTVVKLSPTLMPCNAAAAGDGDLAVGVALNGGAVGEMISVRCFGEITDPSFAFTSGAPVFCGLGGVLTQTFPVRPASAFLLRVGMAVSVTTLLVDPQPAVTLA